VTLEARILGGDDGGQKIRRDAIERNCDGVRRVGRQNGAERDARAVGKGDRAGLRRQTGDVDAPPVCRRHCGR
jgi:hypothetical protein